uniref:Ig-like domain-containing protein n=1 Tax=Monodelphis domestica TaxID=13616 RepID=F6QEA6_MONDO
MNPVSILTLVMLFILKSTEAQSVTQPEDLVSVSEGYPVELKCTYSYSGSPILFWYVQYPNQGLQVLLKHTSGGSNKGFQATLSKTETSYHLRKSHVQEEDSAVYFCALSDTMRRLSRGAKHKPPEAVLEVLL